MNSGVRQSDALSYILFNLAIKSLARAFQSSVLIRGVKLPNGERAKCCLYADDTILFPRDIQELDEIGRILALFEKASGQKIN